MHTKPFHSVIPDQSSIYWIPQYRCIGSVPIFNDNNMQDHLRRFKADFFQALAHPTRIAIIEQLRDGELSAGSLIEKLGVEQANASQHLSVLRTRQILTNRKVGNQVFYSLRDPFLIQILDTMKQYFFRQLNEGKARLDEISAQAVNS